MRPIALVGLVIRRAPGPLASALALALGACGGVSTGEATTGEATTDDEGATAGEDRHTAERTARPAPAGREGDVCEWGERSEASGDPLPTPAPCGEDLSCCYGGGVAGLDSRCMRVAGHGCPRFP